MTPAKRARVSPIVLLVALTASLGLTACGGDQERIETLERQVNRLQSSNGQLISELRTAKAKRRAALSNLSWARDNVRMLRSEVVNLRSTIDSFETLEFEYSDEGYDSSYYSDSYGYGDSYGYSDSYGSSSYFDRDCDDYSYDSFSPGYGDPYGLDADGDGVACE